MPIHSGARLLPLALLVWTLAAVVTTADNDDSVRLTPLVRAIARARPAVVNIRGSKTVPDDEAPSSSGSRQMKQVNGMGTGVVIDPRGYILTNYHVVEDVSQIRISTCSRETVIGELMAVDPRTDLALIKIEPREPLPTIPLGCSTNILLAESVAAIGNAYGYEHTVTEGIVSELGRTVQVSDDQIYYDLIQTDASINPGNSGGPLLNLKGEMIGINVAVRVGAQGIAFAIPVNDAIEVAAELLRQSLEREASLQLAVATRYENDQPGVEVTRIDDAATAAGLQVGDRLISIDGEPCLRTLDVYRALINRRPNDTLAVVFTRGTQRGELEWPLAPAVVDAAHVPPQDSAQSLVWDRLGLEVARVSRETMHRVNPSYDGGLRIVRVRPGSPAERENLRIGDVIVAMAEWKTESVDNLLYVLRHASTQPPHAFKFYIFRDAQPLFGQIRIASALR